MLYGKLLLTQVEDALNHNKLNHFYSYVTMDKILPLLMPLSILCIGPIHFLIPHCRGSLHMFSESTQAYNVADTNTAQ